MIKDLVSLLYESSLISSGFSIEEPATFVNRINNMIKLGLSLDDDDVKEEKEDVKEEKEDVEENMEEID
jgi:molecular chaperone HtpG